MHPIISDAQKSQLKNIPELRSGYTVRVSQKIKEGEKERVQSFEGLIIKVGSGQGVEKNITMRKIVEGVGVEKVFPIHSPTITKIEVKKRAQIRRSKLYYMRKRSGKSARLTETQVTDKERQDEEAKREALIQEAVEADEKRRKAEEAKAAEKAVGETVEASAEDVKADVPNEEEAK